MPMCGLLPFCVEPCLHSTCFIFVLVLSAKSVWREAEDQELELYKVKKVEAG